MRRTFNIRVDSTPTQPSRSLFGCFFLQEVFIWSGLKATLSGLTAPCISLNKPPSHRVVITLTIMSVINCYLRVRHLFPFRSMFNGISQKPPIIPKGWLQQELFLPYEWSRSKWNRVYVCAQGCHLRVKLLPASFFITRNFILMVLRWLHVPHMCSEQEDKQKVSLMKLCPFLFSGRDALTKTSIYFSLARTEACVYHNCKGVLEG